MYLIDYSNLLRSAVKNSGLKLLKIQERMSKEHGLNPSIYYLSRLQNGKVSPAGDRMNEALARVLEIDPLELKTAAYKEKIPEDILRKLTNNSA